MQNISADVIKIAKELEVEVDPEDVTELLQQHDETLMDENLLLLDEQRMRFLERESISGEDAVQVIGITTKDLDC